ELGDDLEELRSALLEDTIRHLGPDDPLCVTSGIAVGEAVERMMAGRRAAVLVVDGQGRLSGIFTERDVLTRGVARGVDPAATPIAAVLTPDPEALRVGGRGAYAANRMLLAGSRASPLHSGEGPRGRRRARYSLLH